MGRIRYKGLAALILACSLLTIGANAASFGPRSDRGSERAHPVLGAPFQVGRGKVIFKPNPGFLKRGARIESRCRDNPTSVPEPGTFLASVLGAAGLVLARRRFA